jgi:hypothetical protein
MPNYTEADAGNILLVLLLLVGKGEYCNVSKAGPIPAIRATGATSGNVKGNSSGLNKIQARFSGKCRSAASESPITETIQSTRAVAP